MTASLDSLSRSSRSENEPPKQKKLPAWSIPAGILLGFALLFLALFRDRLLPAPEVDVAVVIATTSTAGTSAAGNNDSPADGPVLFQASGWVEPDPLPIKATALVDGVVKEVHVLEGEAVKQGQLLATLIDDDQQLALQVAEKSLLIKKAEAAAHLEAVNVGIRAVAASAAQAEAADALLAESTDRLNRVEKLQSRSIAESEIVTVRTAHRRAHSVEEAARAAVSQAEANVIQLEAGCVVLENAVQMAEVEVEKAKLALSRTRISSPVDGRVLRLNAAPGQKKMLGMDDPDSATVAILYQPNHLQVRVDVPLADAAALQIGQKTRIHCSLLPDTVFHGEVTRITGEADLARNTLQAKVRIIDPSEQLRPEMLCRVEFQQTMSHPDGATAITGSLATWIPERALAGSTAWVCNPDNNRVEPRPVTATDEREDGFIRITEGLRPGEWVVLSPNQLKAGQRVRPNLTQS